MAKVINVIYKVDDKELLKVKSSLKSVEAETKKSELQMNKLGDAARYAGQKGSDSFLSFKNILGSITVVGIIAGLTQLGRKILDLGVKQEMLNVSFTTFLGSASRAKKLLAELTEFAIVTPFTPEQVNSASKSLLAFGVQANEIIPTLKMLGDVSAGTGKDLTEMAIIFGQIRSTGRLMGQDLLQLINAGFNPLQVISEKTGKSVAQLKAEMEKGLVTFDMVSDAFKTATTEGGLFFNLMEKQSVTVGGKLSTVAGNIDEIGKKAFSASKGGLSDFLDILVQITSELAKTREANAADFGIDLIAVEQIIGGSQQLIDNLLDNDKYRKYLNDITGLYRQALSDIEKVGKDAINLKLITEEVQTSAELAGVTITLAQAQETANRIYQTAIKAHNDNVQAQNKATQSAINAREAQNAAILAEIEEEKRLRDLTAAQKKLKESIDQRRKALELLMGVGKRLGKDIQDATTEADEKELKRQQENNERSNANAQRQHDYELKKLKEVEDEKNRILEEAAERRIQIQQAVQDFAIDSLQQILYASLLTSEEDFSAQREKFDREMLLAGDNERAKGEIRLREEEAEKAFRERQKKAEKENALKRIAIDTAINVIRSITNNGGIPLGLPFGALALAAGVLQAATVRKLKDGEVGIKGKGTSTSDSIPAMLSVGESVINADATKKSSRLLEAINDRKIDDRILYKIAANGGRQANVFDDSRIVDAINKNKVDYDTHGYTIMKGIQKGKNFKLFIRSKVQGY